MSDTLLHQIDVRIRAKKESICKLGEVLVDDIVRAVNKVKSGRKTLNSLGEIQGRGSAFDVHISELCLLLELRDEVAKQS